jgi:uncharacterized membrane-anchored protein
VAGRHPRVEPQDLVRAEQQYSLFAFEAAAVEGQARVPNIDNVLLEFAGSRTTLSDPELRDVLRAGGVTDEDSSLNSVVDVLRDISFLGLATYEGQAIFTDSPREKQRADVLSRRLANKEGAPVTYQVHPAFWAYLEMERQDQALSFGL